jgi:hypothetical protein
MAVTRFYDILLSNASQKLYPANTFSSFTVHLAQSIDLASTDRLEVGVCEVICRHANVGTYKEIQVVTANNDLIYCDFILKKFVGSQYVRYLRTFIQPTKYCNHIFNNVYYMPVEKRRFQDIQIQILTLEVRLSPSPRAMCVRKSYYIVGAFPHGNTSYKIRCRRLPTYL